MTITQSLEQKKPAKAITMWDFSWLERRWPGAGYEDWDEALDGLVERGYDAVRIDAYPHLLAADPEKEWELIPCWNQHDWGSPAKCRVRVMPALIEFIAKCAERKIGVALSTWFREDSTGRRLLVPTARRHGEIWQRTLELIERAGLLDQILYVDLCNEWPMKDWAPFFNNGNAGQYIWSAEASTDWMRESIALLKNAYPRMDFCFSFASDLENWQGKDVSFLDLLEPHIWMVQGGDFYQRIDYKYECFDSIGYEKLVRMAEPLYRSDEEHWQQALCKCIGNAADWSRASGKPLVTTECWGTVVYKDWPMLDWGWVKELCALGVERAAATNRWAALASSNFCGPQFVGMWRDVAWHQRLTKIIRQPVT